MKTQYLFVFMILLATGCAAQGYRKGFAPDGQRVYLGSTDLEQTKAFQTFLKSPRAETDRQHYLFDRLMESEGLEFFHDGAWYGKIEAYRGGMWLMRHRYQKGQETRDFIKKNIYRSDKGNVHLVKYPDGSIQEGASILYNELTLLEETLRRKP